MANSLQDQLLKAGLTDKNKVNKAKKAKQRREKEQRHRKQKADDEAVRWAKQAKAKDVERDRALNQKKNEQAKQKAIAAQIRQLIEMNRLPLEEGEVAYHFNDETKVRRIFITDEIHGQLTGGRLAIVKIDDHYDVIPTAVADKISMRNRDCIVVRNDREQQDDSDDPYADYIVPDDLMW
ncbi:MAG: DUF2058 domain-containing protein [Candidatus Thiodiazotropha sp.]